MDESKEKINSSPTADDAQNEVPPKGAKETPPELSSNDEATEEADESTESDESTETDTSPRGGAGGSSTPEPPDRPEIGQEILKLIELSMKYPEIGPPVAELAFKAGYSHLGERVLRMGLQEETHGVEYHFLAAKLARRQGQHEEALERVQDAVEKTTANPQEDPPEWRSSLLHLVRLGFSILLFDLKDLEAKPSFTQTLGGALERVSHWYEKDPFYLTLLAQARWFGDKSASQATWEEAVDAGGDDTTWNSRGTWYKEAERDLAKAEEAYTRGLETFPKSPLLLHNLAQVIMDRARDESREASPSESYREAHGHLRQALRESHRPRLRRHIHSTMDRLKVLRSSSTPSAPPKLPGVGDVRRGRVRNLKPYGAFVDIGGGHSGLLHKSELAHEWVDDPAAYLKPGDEIQVKILEVKPRENGKGLRIGLSRKQLLSPAGEAGSSGKTGGGKPPHAQGNGGDGNRRKEPKRGPKKGRGERRGRGKGEEKPIATLGEILWAQLSKEGGGDGDDGES